MKKSEKNLWVACLTRKIEADQKVKVDMRSIQFNNCKTFLVYSANCVNAFGEKASLTAKITKISKSAVSITNISVDGRYF